MITYNKAKPASNEMSDYKRVLRTDDFSRDLSFLQSLRLLREPCQLYHHQCKWHFKESLRQIGNANADQRCWCSAHFSQSSVTSCVSAHLALIVSFSDEPVVAPLLLSVKTQPLKTTHFPASEQCGMQQWQQQDKLLYGECDNVKSAGFRAW